MTFYHDDFFAFLSIFFGIWQVLTGSVCTLWPSWACIAGGNARPGFAQLGLFGLIRPSIVAGSGHMGGVAPISRPTVKHINSSPGGHSHGVGIFFLFCMGGGGVIESGQ